MEDAVVMLTLLLTSVDYLYIIYSSLYVLLYSYNTFCYRISYLVFKRVLLA